MEAHKYLNINHGQIRYLNIVENVLNVIGVVAKPLQNLVLPLNGICKDIIQNINLIKKMKRKI